MDIVSALFRVARLGAWARAARSPRSLGKRIRNRYVLTKIGPWLRK